MDVGPVLEVDVTVREIGALPDPPVAGYVAVDGRVGWTPSAQLELSLTGTNLFDARHPEYGTLPRWSAMGRTVYAAMRWKL
jgi:outer membrane receptor protein involved in Fe transport